MLAQLEAVVAEHQHHRLLRQPQLLHLPQHPPHLNEEDEEKVEVFLLNPLQRLAHLLVREADAGVVGAADLPGLRVVESHLGDKTVSWASNTSPDQTLPHPH